MFTFAIKNWQTVKNSNELLNAALRGLAVSIRNRGDVKFCLYSSSRYQENKWHELLHDFNIEAMLHTLREKFSDYFIVLQFTVPAEYFFHTGTRTYYWVLEIEWDPKRRQ